MKTTTINKICLLAIALVLLSVSGLLAQDMFDARIDYAAGNGPYSVYAADLDGVDTLHRVPSNFSNDRLEHGNASPPNGMCDDSVYYTRRNECCRVDRFHAIYCIVWRSHSDSGLYCLKYGRRSDGMVSVVLSCRKNSCALVQF